MILSELERYGADSKTMIVREDIGTSYTVILAPAGIDRIMFHCSGANDEFVLDHIDLDRVKQANLFHFGYPSLMRNMYIDGGKELCRLLKAVHELGWRFPWIWQCSRKHRSRRSGLGCHRQNYHALY